MKKVLLLMVLILAVPELSYSRVIYDANNKILYWGGGGYSVAQPYEGKDLSLKKKVFKYDLIKNEKKEFFHNPDYYVGTFSLSPDGQHLAINTKKDGANKTPENYYKIVVLNTKGETVATINNTVRIFEWSPDSRYIAYISGHLLSEQRYPFKADGLWIYDVKEDKKEKIADKGYRLSFSQYDGKLHFKDGLHTPPIRIFEYDLKTKKLNRARSHGLYFSPNGKFFIRRIADDDETLRGLYATENDKKIHWFSIVEGFEERFGDTYWLNDKLIFNFFLPRSFVYDPFKKKIIHEFEGKVMGWSADRKYIVSYKDKEAIITETVSGKIIGKYRIRE